MPLTHLPLLTSHLCPLGQPVTRQPSHANLAGMQLRVVAPSLILSQVKPLEQSSVLAQTLAQKLPLRSATHSNCGPLQSPVVWHAAQGPPREMTASLLLISSARSLTASVLSLLPSLEFRISTVKPLSATEPLSSVPAMTAKSSPQPSTAKEQKNQQKLLAQRSILKLRTDSTSLPALDQTVCRRQGQGRQPLPQPIFRRPPPRVLA